MAVYDYPILCPHCERRGDEGDLRLVAEGALVRIVCVTCERVDITVSSDRVVSTLSALVEEIARSKSLSKKKLLGLAGRLLR